MYDVIVVGARVAGAPAAMLLARSGHRVLMVDRDRFPSDTMSTHYLHQPGVERLRAWGLLDRVLATGCEPITRLTVSRGDVALSGIPRFGELDFTLCPRRFALDTVLVRAAMEAGAELREDFIVEQVLIDDGRVTGIRGHQRGGPTVEERARIVIGADGVHSLVAKTVNAEAYNVHPPKGCGYYAYYSGVPMDGAEVHFRDDCILFGFPTNDGQTCIAVEWPHARFHEIRTDIEAHVVRALQEAPEFAARVAAGRRETRFVGTGDLPNYYRRPFGPGWALVGDAGYHKDPVTGNGIMDAFLDAELVATAVSAGLDGRRAFDEALADYEQQRNERTAPLYEFTLRQLTFGPPPPEQLMLMRALQGNQADTDRFLGLNSGVTPMAEFMAPENLGRIFGQSQQQTVPA